MPKQVEKKERYSPTLDRIGQSQKREGRVVSWDNADAGAIVGLVLAVNSAGGSVLFGSTRDRGAWAVTVFHDQLPYKKKTEYCNSEDMLDDWLLGLAEIWRDVAAELGSVD